MKRDASPGLLLSTTGCLVIVNVLIAQAILYAFYPHSGARLGAAALTALAVLALACAIISLQGWRSYLRRPPDE